MHLSNLSQCYKSTKWSVATDGVGEGYKKTLYCDKLKFGAVCGVDSGVYVSERLCWNSEDFGGEGVGNTKEGCVVVGIVAELEVWFCSMGGVGSVVGGGSRGFVVVELSMMQCWDVYYAGEYE